MHPLLADPWIAAQVEDAVRPWVGRLSAGEIAWMRDQLAETLATDEKAAKLLHRARPTVVEESGEVRRGSPASSAASEPERRAAGDGIVVAVNDGAASGPKPRAPSELLKRKKGRSG